MIGTTNAVGSNVTADMLGIVIKGNSTTIGADTIGQYVIVKNSTISDRPDGLYTAAKVIPANTAIDATYLSEPISGGGLNSLKNDIFIKRSGYSIGTPVEGEGTLTSQLPSGELVVAVYVHVYDQDRNIKFAQQGNTVYYLGVTNIDYYNQPAQILTTRLI